MGYRKNKDIILTEIGSLLTLQSASKKQGRHLKEKDLSIKKKQAIAIENGKIAWLGPVNKIPQELTKRIKNIMSLEGRTVLPGFVECHTHTVFSGDRAHEYEMRQQGKSYLEISKNGGGIISTVKSTRKSSFIELQELAQKRVDHFVRQGVTSLEIKSGYGLRLKDEMKMLEVAKSLKGPRVITTYLGPHSKPPEYKKNKAEDYENYIEQIIKKDLPKIAKLSDRVDIFIEKGFFTLEQGRKYLQAAQELGLALTVHADQLSNSGAGRLAVELGAESADHLVEIKAKDIRKLASSETTSVLLPAADYYLKMSYPPARKLIDAGARVALATDFNPGSSPTQDLAFVGLLARQEMKMSLPEVIGAYTLNAAHALGLESEVGSIEVGKNADLAVLNSEWTELFYHVGQMPVEQVFLSGKKICN